MDAAGLGALCGGVGALATAGGGLLGLRASLNRKAAQCEDKLADAWTIIGILLMLLPGGELAEQFNGVGHHEAAVHLDHARHRWRSRVEDEKDKRRRRSK